MLGIRKLSPGRLGNRLFHYNFLRQLARKTELDYFHLQFPEAEYFPDMKKRLKPRFRFRKSVELNSRDILAYQTSQFLGYVAEQDQAGYDIFFSPPMLGEIFFDYLFYDPNEFIKVNDAYKADHKFNDKDALLIGLHFRGTDFPAWNQHAALKFDYYQSALLFCLDFFKDENIVFSFFTDDLEYPAYTQTLAFLSSITNAPVIFGDTKKAPVYDLYCMSQCDVLVSSPSTFAIFAGVLGKKKKIIHSAGWLDYALDRHDSFWVHLNETDNPYYRLWKTF